MSTPVLECKNVCYSYHNLNGETKALSDLSFRIDRGEFVAIVGPSGCGKSTLLSLISGLLMPQSGEILLEKEASAGIGYMLQQDHLFEWRSIWKNILLGLEISGTYSPQKKALAEKLLKDYGLYAFKDKKPNELSGGMMQRTAIALSLLNNPEMILFDEATTALDRITQGQILMEVKRLEKEFNLTRIMITHDISVVASSCTHIAVLYAGRLMETGTTADVLKQPLHPYTIGLLNAFPKLHGEKTRMTGISGSLPDLSQPIPGCVFAPRCPYATEECRKCAPPLTDVGNGRQIACHHPAGKEEKQ